MHQLRYVWEILFCCLPLLPCMAEEFDLSIFGKTKLIDYIDCSLKNSLFQEYPAGASHVDDILGRKCRVMPIQEGEGSFFGYRIGKGKGLVANKAYVLLVEFPEDVARSVIINNGATEAKRGFYTGRSLGDAWSAKYVNNNCESLNLPLSGKYQYWCSLMFMQDRTKPNNGESRSLTPADGFDVTFSQFARENNPVSEGIAVSRIFLYEILDKKEIVQPLVYPQGLPIRHLFWREEMADDIIEGNCGRRGMNVRLDWYIHKAETLRFLGMNTFSKDLFEFGACQHWDPDYIRPEWIWNDPSTGSLWTDIVKLMGEYHLHVLPYYEYAGSLGPDGLGEKRLARPLGDNDKYTHIPWVEKANVDITAPETYDDFKDIIDATVIRYRKDADMLGIWIRSRNQIPVGFSDATRERFAKEANNGEKITRNQLKNNGFLYQRYLEWWGRKRAEFCHAMSLHMIRAGIKDAKVIFDSCSSEPGPELGGKRLLVVDSALSYGNFDHRFSLPPSEILTVEEISRNHLYLKAMTSPAKTWGEWEWQHVSPADDPHHYQNMNHVFLAHPFNRVYTVADPLTFQKYANRSGGVALIRHYPLNENMVFRKNGKKEERIVGYSIADMEYAGRACMIAELTAMVHGDPYFIGYLTGSTYTRGFPHAVREFNANFLALPALPSYPVSRACSDPDVILRRIDTSSGKVYFALIHIGAERKRKIEIHFPEDVSHLQSIVDNKSISTQGNVTVLDFEPYQLIAVQGNSGPGQ